MTSAIDPIDERTEPAKQFLRSSGPNGQHHDSANPHVFIGELDIATGLTGLAGADRGGRRWTEGRILVRCFTEPIGLLRIDLPVNGLSVAALLAALEDQLGNPIRAKLRQAGVEVNDALPTNGVESVRVPYLEGRRQALVAAPAITVAICTRDRPDMLRLSLRSLELQGYPALRILVVDNAPSDARTRQVASEVSRTVDVEYVLEPRPGLSWARNRAIEASSSEIIAWLDDDERADRLWVTELVRALHEHPEAGAVSGIILPGEIESWAQLWFEDGGGHHKGRGFEPLIFSPASRGIQSPLYPRPQFGTGGNMAFRRDAIESIGRFNTALGAGTATKGAEDTSAFSEHLYAGGTLVYHPSAVVWHTHRSSVRQLQELRRGYGRGISAFYLSFLIRHPAALKDLVRLLPKAIGDIATDSEDHPELEGKLDAASPPEHTPPSAPTPQFSHDLYRGLLEGIPLYLFAALRSYQLGRKSGQP